VQGSYRSIHAFYLFLDAWHGTRQGIAVGGGIEDLGIAHRVVIGIEPGLIGFAEAAFRRLGQASGHEEAW